MRRGASANLDMHVLRALCFQYSILGRRGDLLRVSVNTDAQGKHREMGEALEDEDASSNMVILECRLEVSGEILTGA